MRRSKAFLPVLAGATLAVLTACGGGGGSSSSTKTPYFVYTAPTPNTGQPVVQLNNGMSNGNIAVFDVVGTAASTLTRGLDFNITVDSSKLLPVGVPGTASPTIRPVVGTGIDTGGFGGGQAMAIRTDRSDGLAHMATAIRYPAAAVASNTVVMRFAYQLSGSPVDGVIRAEVGTGGLLDSNGKVLPGTAPAMGRLELHYK
jgi:hypothetical protein